MVWTLCTSGAALMKAGTNRSAAISSSGALMNELSTQAEGTISALTRKDWVTDYSSVGTTFKGILNDTCSSLIAMSIINYDMSNYTSRVEAQTMLDVLRDAVSRNVEILKEDEYKEVMD